MDYDGIYAIVDRALSPRPLEILDAILRGGVRLVQYRAKAGVDRALVREMVRRTRAVGGKLIVNDDLEAALEADGWHGGQEDLLLHDPVLVRRRLGERIFGISCASAAEARAAEALGADYAGVGPFAATASKRDAGPPIGPDGVRAVVRGSRLPVVAIGGIELGNLPAVAASGAAMAAVISAIALDPDPESAATALVDGWRSARSSVAPA